MTLTFFMDFEQQILPTLNKVLSCVPLLNHQQHIKRQRISRKQMTRDAKTYSVNKLGFLFLFFITDIILVHLCFRSKVPAAAVSTPVHASPEQRIRSVLGLRCLLNKDPGTESRQSLLHSYTGARPRNVIQKSWVSVVLAH